MIDQALTMIPGPTPVHERILAELARPTVSHVAPSFVATFRDCLERVRRVVLGEQGHPFLVAGGGTLAMEMALVNLVRAGEPVLILSQGYFGDRYAQLAEALGLSFELVQAEWGRVVSPEELERRLGERRWAAVAMTHVDTSTGAAAPVADYCGLLRGRDEMVIVDGVCATAGTEERFDEWGIDVLLTGAQKAFGAPPGLAMLVVSPRAIARRRELGAVRAYYADLLRWAPIMEDPTKYFSTPPVNEIWALHEAAGLILAEGLEARFARHRRLAASVRAGLTAAGCVTFTHDEALADTLSVFRYPDGIADGEFRTGLAKRGVVVAGALGPIAGQAFRVGHMGNIGPGEVARLLHAAEETLRELGHSVEPGTAVTAAAPHWSPSSEAVDAGLQRR
jgi:alanine-glyoxylate transaminase/serine-glyoxylate transaminase/serine-pyruvate transaminase